MGDDEYMKTFRCTYKTYQPKLVGGILICVGICVMLLALVLIEESDNPLWLTFMLMGGVQIISGISLLFKKDPEGIPELAQTGIPVCGVVTYSGDMGKNKSGERVYGVIAEYFDTNGKKYVAYSGLLSFDPTDFVERNGKTVVVYVDPKAPTRFYIDPRLLQVNAYQPYPGFNPYFNQNGYNPNLYNPNGYNPNAYNPNGYNPNVNNQNGYNPNGYNQDGTPRY